ncbi:NAD-dependent epimerase/dehydratase [Rapidithrix thailandica]|uniref:NAD-dependent epimerase/dehydratase n=1 Tax=Rapidithrix thailandica TaxID=413964 RepID=A0AAW9SDH1_9BACT
MRVLITGGAGYIGTSLIFELVTNPEISEIIIFDNLSRKNYNLFLAEKYPYKPIRFVKGDVLDSRKLRQVLQGVDIVYHLAAKVTTPFANENPHSFEQVNHWGTAELSYAIEDSDVQTVIYTSSTSVYGPSDTEINETTVPRPKTYYGISKFQGEHMISRLEEQRKAIVLRLGNVYGYNKSMRFDAVINKFMFEAHFLNHITVQGSGVQSRAFINIDKVATVLDKLPHMDVPSGTYNLVERNLSINEIAEHTQEIYPDLQITYIQQELELNSIAVSPESVLNAYDLVKESDFKRELLLFKDSFAFKLYNRH